MKRYGDNVSHKDALEDEVWAEKERAKAVFYGGCAASYGSFPRVPSRRKASDFDLLTFFKSLYKKPPRAEN